MWALDRKLKLDLHTHCRWATGYLPATPETVRLIVDRVKACGLDGIAVTEHWDREYGLRVKKIVQECFGNEVLIIPGQEVDRAGRHEVELYLPDDSIFRFLAHPGHPLNSCVVDGINGIEIDNSQYGWQINRDWVREMAMEHGLLLLRNSDAHSMESIGHFYNELSLRELCGCAERGKKSVETARPRSILLLSKNWRQ